MHHKQAQIVRSFPPLPLLSFISFDTFLYSSKSIFLTNPVR